jgi:uncharacterized BrkB/YihY/UPF0761 family membrane protein
MSNDRRKSPVELVLQDFRRLSTGAWIAIAALLLMLVLAIVFVSRSGTDDLAAGVSGPGTLAMIFGVLFTMVVGCGLMGLIFYSSRRGYDEPPAADRTDEGDQP